MRFLWMKRYDRLTNQDRERLNEFMDSCSETARAYQLKTLWDDFYKQPTENDAKGFLKAWVNASIDSKRVPMMKIGCSINHHWKQFVSWINSRISTAINEDVNSLVQAVRSRARGYRNTQNVTTQAGATKGPEDTALRALFTPAELGLSDPRPALVPGRHPPESLRKRKVLVQFHWRSPSGHRVSLT